MNLSIPNRLPGRTNKIVVHCTETPFKRWYDIDICRKDHIKKGWLDVAYQGLIQPDGSVQMGRGFYQVGAHTHGWNSTSIAFALVGGEGAKRDDEFGDHYTPLQGDALRYLIRVSLVCFPGAEVLSHHDAPDVTKACPGFDAAAWWDAQPKHYTPDWRHA